MKKRVRFFLRRSTKVEIQAERKIIIPFKFATLLLLTVSGAISLFLFLRSDIFQINKVELTGKIPNCATEEGIKLTTEAVGRSIIFFNTSASKDGILKKFYCIADIKLSKIYPVTLKVAIFERIPIVAAARSQSLPEIAAATTSATTSAVLASPSAFFAVDIAGVIFENLSQNTNLPKLYLSENLTLGAKITDFAILWVLEFLEKSADYNLSFLEFTKTQEEVLLGRTKDGVQLIMSAKTDPGKTAASLQAILREAKIEGAKFSILDLRFEKPILK